MTRTGNKKAHASKRDPSGHVATAADLHNLSAESRALASQGRNANRRSMFMPSELFKKTGTGDRHKTTTAAVEDTTTRSRAHTTDVVASGTFTPEHASVNQRLKDSDSASVRSTSSMRSNFAQRIRRVFSASNMFTDRNGGGEDEDGSGRGERGKQYPASAPGSRADTPDNAANNRGRGQGRSKQQRPPVHTQQTYPPSPAPSNGRSSASSRRRAGSASSGTTERTVGNNNDQTLYASIPRPYANGRASFSSSSSSVQSGQQQRTGALPPNSGGVRGSRRGSASSIVSSPAATTDPRYARTGTGYANHPQNNGSGSSVSTSSFYHTGENGSVTSLASAPAGYMSNGAQGYGYHRDSRSASFASGVNRRPAMPSPLGQQQQHQQHQHHNRSMSFNNMSQYQAAAAAAAQMNMSMHPQFNHRSVPTYPGMMPHQSFVQPPIGSAHRQSWVPQMARPASPYFSNANAGAVMPPAAGNGNSYPRPPPTYHQHQQQQQQQLPPQQAQYRTPIATNTFQTPDNNAAQWDHYRQTSASEPMLRVPEAAAVSNNNNAAAANGQNIAEELAAARQSMAAMTISEQGEAEAEAELLERLALADNMHDNYSSLDDDNDDEDEDVLCSETEEDSDLENLPIGQFADSRPSSRDSSPNRGRREIIRPGPSILKSRTAIAAAVADTNALPAPLTPWDSRSASKPQVPSLDVSPSQSSSSSSSSTLDSESASEAVTPVSTSGEGSVSDQTISAATPTPANSNKASSSSSSVATPKRFRFNERVLVGETWPAGEYDRRGEAVVRLTPALAHAIKMELNEFKAKEMVVHEESRIYTHLLA